MNARVEYRRSNLVYEDILHNLVDFGLVAFPQNNRLIESVPFCEDRLVLICHPKHSLVKEANVTLESLGKQKFVSFDPDIPTRKAIDQIFKERKIEIVPTMEFDNIETVKRAVEIDAGIALVPSATVKQEVEHGTLVAIPLAGDNLNRPLAILYRKGRVLTPAMKKFLKTLTGGELTESNSQD